VTAQPDFAKNVLPHLYRLEEDEAGPDPAEVSKRYGISLESIAVLSRNENPYGPSPLVRQALADVPMNRYPDSRSFIEALSKYTGLPGENIVIGAGMDEIIATVCRIFLGPGDRGAISYPTYSLYALATQLCGGDPLYYPRKEDFSVDGVPAGAKMAFICSPNNPTGNAISEESVRAILEGTDAIVFLDEAYAEFAEGASWDWSGSTTIWWWAAPSPRPSASPACAWDMPWPRPGSQVSIAVWPLSSPSPACRWRQAWPPCRTESGSGNACSGSLQSGRGCASACREPIPRRATSSTFALARSQRVWWSGCCKMG